ncbi:MAG: hypothetical protein F4W92_00455 [Gammaproteobacteria bacterium]|nr:hypothetical protein [Gammaproteobacteria bacterium]
MSLRRSRFADYEAFVLKVARVVLVALASISFLAIPIALVWLGFTMAKPTGIDYKHNLYVPTYESIDASWRPSAGVRTEDLNAAKIPPVMNETIETIDSLYQLVGREEQKFSETHDLQQFHTALIEPFAKFEDPNTYDIDFLIELKQYAESMVQDELLKRIADVNARTTAIVDSIFKFRDKYLINLDGALATVESRSTEHGWNRMVTSLLVLQVLSVCITLFVVSAVCLLGFRVGLNHEGRAAVPSTSTIYDEDS